MSIRKTSVSKIKIIHIHTDLKFVDESKIFEGDNFDNVVIMIGERNNYQGFYKNSAIFYSRSLKSYRAIIKLCAAANMVVLYDLNFPKAYIANRLPNSIKVIWRFFGAELYSKIPEYVYSEQTVEASHEDNERNGLAYYKDKCILLFNNLRYRTNFNKEFEKAAFSRVNYFLGFSDEEHRFLKEHWSQLPPFLQISYDPYTKVNIYKKNGSKVIIGNNRSPFNNHLDIIEIIKNASLKTDFQFLMLFSYGQTTSYSKTVRAKVADVKEIQVIEEFLPLDKLSYLYAESDALVINGYRQMAMFNIFLAIYVNTKVYLNPRNITYNWLKKEGFLIFPIDDLNVDLENNNTKLTELESIKNQQELIKFTAKYNHQLFQSTVMELMN